MRVYNLKSYDLHFKKAVIPANGGSKNFPELDKFISDSDKSLADAGVISFGFIPDWWVSPTKIVASPEPVKEQLQELQPPSDSQEVTVESQKFMSNKQKKREQFAGSPKE